MDPVSQVIANLRSWRGLPGYSVERRLDLLLTPFIPGFLSDVMGGKVELVTAEFPLPKVLFQDDDKTRQHISADFLCVRRGREPAWLLMWNDLSTAQERSFGFPILGEAGQAAVEAAVATVDHSDVRGSEPHGRDPSGAVSY